MTAQEAQLLLHLEALRLGAGLSQEVRQLLLGLQQEVLAALREADLAQARRQASTALFFLLPTLTGLIAAAYREVEVHMQGQSARLARRQADSLVTRLNALDVQDAPLVPPAEDGTLDVAIAATPFPSATEGTQPSATAAEWWARQGERLTQGVGDQLRAALVAGETARVLEQRVTGTRGRQGKDGLMHRALRSAEAVALAQAAMAATQGTGAVIQGNPGMFDAVEHISVIDDRTTATCQFRHRKRWHAATHRPLGHGLLYASPPLHIGCRSYLRLVFAHETSTERVSPTLPGLLAALPLAEQRRLLGIESLRQWQAGRLQGRDLVQAIVRRLFHLERERVTGAGTLP